MASATMITTTTTSDYRTRALSERSDLGESCGPCSSCLGEFRCRHPPNLAEPPNPPARYPKQAPLPPKRLSPSTTPPLPADGFVHLSTKTCRIFARRRPKPSGFREWSCLLPARIAPPHPRGAGGAVERRKRHPPEERLNRGVVAEEEKSKSSNAGMSFVVLVVWVVQVVLVVVLPALLIATADTFSGDGVGPIGAIFAAADTFIVRLCYLCPRPNWLSSRSWSSRSPP